VVEVECILSLMRFRVCSSLIQYVIVVKVNQRPDGALRWKVEEHRLGRSGSVMWHAGTSKVVASTCVGYGPMGWAP
jgi:hypothetical protein